MTNTLMPTVDLIRLERGLSLRLELARCYRDNSDLTEKFAERHDSLGRDYYSSFFHHRSFGRNDASIDVNLIHIILFQDSIIEQEDMYSATKAFFKHPYAGRLVIGEQADFQVDELETIKSAIDYSLVVQSYLNDCRTAFSNEIRNQYKSYFDEIKNIFGISGQITTISELAKFLPRHNFSTSAPPLKTLYHLVTTLKSECWFIIGVVALNRIERLISVNSAGDALQQSLHFQDSPSLFDSFDELEFKIFSILKYLDTKSRQELPAPPVETQSKKISVPQLIENLEKGQVEYFKDLNEHYVNTASHLFHQLMQAADHGNFRVAFHTVSIIYQLDERLLYHLDWKYLHYALPPEKGGYTFERCVFELCFIEFTSPVAHAIVKLVRGDTGTFISSMLPLLEKIRANGRDHRQIVGDIKSSLPPKAARFLTTSILKRSYLQRLRRKFPAVTIYDPKSVDTYTEEEILTRLRLVLAKAAKERALITGKQYEEIKSQEQSANAIRFFQRELDKGRIRLPWYRLKRKAEELVDDSLSYFIINKIEPEDIHENRDLIETIITNEVEDFLHHCIFDSSTGFDTIIASNLRHGVISTVYASLFNKVLLECDYVSTQSVWDKQEIETIFEDSFSEIDTLRRNILQLLNDYMAKSLTIRKTDQFYTELIESLINKIVHILQYPVEQRVHYKDEVFSEIQSAFVNVIASAKEKFDNTISADILSQIDETISALAKKPNQHTKFSDSLKLNIAKTNKTVSRWIAVVTGTKSFEDFSIRDLVKAEAKLIYLSELEDMRIAINCSIDGENVKDIHFNGNYYELLNEINHNLISNCFEHSGNDVHTDVTFYYDLDAEKLTIKAINDLSRAGLASAKNSLMHARELASGKLEYGAGALKHTGFEKIRGITQQIPGCVSSINVDIVESHGPKYVVSVEVSGIQMHQIYAT